MIDKEDWVDIGGAEELARTPLKSCKVRTIAIAISFKEGQFGAVSNVCILRHGVLLVFGAPC